MPATTSVLTEVQDTRGAFANATVTLVDNPLGCGLIVSSDAIHGHQGGKREGEPLGHVRRRLSSPMRSRVEATPLSTPQTASYADRVVTITGLSTAVTDHQRYRHSHDSG